MDQGSSLLRLRLCLSIPAIERLPNDLCAFMIFFLMLISRVGSGERAKVPLLPEVHLKSSSPSLHYLCDLEEQFRSPGKSILEKCLRIPPVVVFSPGALILHSVEMYFHLF